MITSESLGPLTLDAIRDLAAELLGEPSSTIADDDDLIRLGIDSVRIMRFANELRRWGANVKFSELVEQPSLTAWWAIIAPRLGTANDDVIDGSVVDHHEPFDLAPMQQAYWVGRNDAHAVGGVGAHFYAELDGTGVDADRLTAAVRMLIQRHPMLRARFLEDGRQQVMAEPCWHSVTTHDLRASSADEAAEQLAQLRHRLTHRRLGVERGEVFDVQLSLLASNKTRVHLNIDMLVADALSFQVILDDLASLYARPEEPLPAIQYSFRQYLDSQAVRRAESRLRAADYWAERLPSMPAAPQLPLVADPNRVTGAEVRRRWRPIAKAQWDRLADRSRRHGVTLPVALLTAFAEVVAAFSADHRFLLNLPLFDRESLHPDVPRLVGDFSNLLVLAVDLSTNEGFLDHALTTQARLRTDAANAEFSGLDVLRLLARARPDERVGAPVVFTSTIGMGELFHDEVRRQFGDPGWTTSQTPQVWLDHQVTERDAGLLVNWDVVEELFPEGVVDAMFDAYVGLLGWLGDEEADWTAATPPLLPRSQQVVRAAVNATEGPESGRLLHEAFFDRAGGRPADVAVAWGEDGELSYGELSTRARQVAALLQKRGVGIGDTVAVTLPRGPAQVVAVLGILAAGGVYVPVGVDQPAQRRARIYRHAGAAVVLTGAQEATSLSWPEDIEVVALDDAGTDDALEQPVAMSPEALAYVIYTSGSTGEPKGVEITHRSAVNTVEDINERFDVGEGDRVLAVSALDFDLSVYDMFGVLSSGGAVVLVEEDARREPKRWLELVRRWGVTVWNSVPALLDMALVTAGDGAFGDTVRLAMVSGDWVGLDLPGRLGAAAPGCRLVALGGATEAAIWSNAYEVTGVGEHWRSIPYGYPLRNQKFRVVDGRGRDCPDWVPGELWIGGVGVARGYRGDPLSTAAHFVEHNGERWYRTGDLGRYWSDGTLEFLGRIDHQVKVRGHRIELGEIEAALEANPHVDDAAVITVGEQRAPRLAAVIAATEADIDLENLRAFLSERVPAYMVPNTVVVVDRLPLTANGKVDRRALSRLVDIEAPTAVDEPPQGDLETAVAELWAQLLGVDSVGRHDNFIALGGDSLMATRMVSVIDERFAVEVTLRQLFSGPTIAEVAAVIEAHVGSGSPTLEEGVV